MNKNDDELITLGTALVYDPAAAEVTDMISDPEAFTEPIHQAIFAALRQTFSRNMAIDIGEVQKVAVKRLKGEVGSEIENLVLIEVLTLQSYATAPSAIFGPCSRVADKHLKKKIIKALNVVRGEALDPTSTGHNVLAKYDTEGQKLIEKDTSQATWQAQLQEAVAQAEIQVTKGGLLGKPTGFTKLDLLTGGWQGGHLITIAARPGAGKSALALQSWAFNAKRGTACLVFSREMTSREIINRMIAQSSDYFDGDRVSRLQKEDLERYMKEVGDLDKLPLTINEHDVHLDSILFSIRKFVMRNPECIVFIDYVQLLKGFKGEGRKGPTETLTDITRELKQAAKELNVPIIILAQLNRDVDSRGSGVPQLSDLKQSGSIEEDSNMVIFINRPEAAMKDVFADGEDATNRVELIVAKNRGGKIGRYRLNYYGYKVLFKEDGYAS